MALVLAACGGGDDDDSTGGEDGDEDGSGIVIAAEQELTNWNQNLSADNILWGAMVVRLIWPQMYYQTPDFKLEPGFIADGPAEVVTEDPFTVRWKINPDATWSDGTPVTSDDLEYYWQSCNGAVDEGEPVDPEDATVSVVDCVSTDGYDQVTTFTKVDEKTAEAVFAAPIAEYDALFANPMPPAHIARAAGENGWAEAFIDEPGASAGPYQLREWVKGESLTLELNPEFYGTPANLETITFRFIEEPGQMVDALRNGEVDLIYPQPQTDMLAQVDEIPSTHSEINFGPTWEHITFNFRNPILADAAVRQAIVLATDRDELVEALMKPFSEEATVLNNRIFMNGNEGYQDNSGDLGTANVDEANQILDDAGWVEGGDGIREKDGERLALRIITTGGNTLREDTEELLQSQYAEIGLELTIDNRPGADAFDVIFGGEETAADWDIALFAWVGTVTPAISSAPVYGTDQGNNPGAFANAEIDEVFAQSIAELDQTARFALLNDADVLMWGPDALPDLPLYQKPTYLAYNERFTGVVDNTTSEGFTWNAQEWDVE